MERGAWVRLTAALIGVWFASVLPAQAGMTVYGLKDVIRLRLEEISFFVLLFLACTVLFRVLWNYGLQGMGSLPSIGYLQSFCMAVVLGLAILLILTMISGIREVLTPGAWQRQGSRYHLTHPSKDALRLSGMQQLRIALWDYARAHGGRFPPHDYVAEIPEKLWEAPDGEGTRYVYMGGLSTNDYGHLLVAEPPSLGVKRYVLGTEGTVQQLSEEAILAQWKLPRAIR